MPNKQLSLIQMEADKLRRPKDFYETPPGIVRSLIHEINLNGRAVFEPCAGELAIARFFPDCLTNDIVAKRPTDLHFDATREDLWPERRRDWVITNPPFSIASKILPIAHEWAYMGVAMLLRLTYLEPTEDRGKWLQDREADLTDLIIFNPRPKLAANKSGKAGTDSVTLAWMVWRKGAVGRTFVKFDTTWKENNHAFLDFNNGDD